MTTPTFDLNSSFVKKLIARAKRKGFITCDELNELLPQDQMSSEQIEDIMSAIIETGVNIVEEEDEFHNPDEFHRSRQLAGECFDQLLAIANARWGIITQEEIDQTVEALNLTAEQILLVLKKFENWSLHIVRLSDLEADGMPGPGVIPRRSYQQRIASGEPQDPRQLAISLDEIEQFGPCDDLLPVKSKLGVSNVNALLSAKQFDLTGVSFNDLFWVAGMQSTVSSLSMRRLSGFVADVSLELLRSLEAISAEEDDIRRSILAGRDFAKRQLTVGGYLRELRLGQQAWLRHAGKDPMGTEFPWTVKNSHRSYSHATSTIDGWREWAECMAWYIDEVRGMYATDWEREGSQARHDQFEVELAALLAQWFSTTVPEKRSIDEWKPEAGARPNIRGSAKVQGIDLGWSSFAVLPETAVRVERIDMEKNAVCDSLPHGLKSLGAISLFRVGGELYVPSSVTEIDHVDVDESSLTLPTSVKRVGSLEVRLHDDSFQGKGVIEFGQVEFTLADHNLPEGVVKIGGLKTDGSNVQLPASLREIGDVYVEDSFYDEDASERQPATLYWEEGPTGISFLELGDNIPMELPRSVKTIGRIKLAKGSRLSLADDTVIVGACEIETGATLNLRPTTVEDEEPK